jgi:hypothetical protein
MPRSLKSRNPFYALLVVAGLAFALTATGYCVMAFREARPIATLEEQRAPLAPHPLDAWMREHGETALLIELAFLAAFTVAAITTDNFWQRRAS